MRAAFARAMLVTMLLGAALEAAAEQAIYRQVDRHGHVTWSDRPDGEASRPAPPRIIRRSAVPPEAAAAGASEKARSGPFVPYRQMRLTGPEGPVSAARGKSGVAVRLSLSPALKSGHRVQLRVGDRIAQSALAATVLMALNLEPGYHRLVAELVGPTGAVRQRSTPLRLEILP